MLPLLRSRFLGALSVAAATLGQMVEDYTYSLSSRPVSSMSDASSLMMRRAMSFGCCDVVLFEASYESGV